MSALPPKADMVQLDRDIRYVPKRGYSITLSALARFLRLAGQSSRRLQYEIFSFVTLTSAESGDEAVMGELCPATVVGRACHSGV